jgi:hypothetical protein
VFLTYDSEDLDVTSGGGNYQTVVMTTVTDGSGKFAFSVPTSPNGVDCTLSTSDFELEFKDAAGDNQSAVFSGGTATENNVLPGMSRIVQDYEDIR